ncbi:magnesium transporter [Nematocida sp. LUAm3]|nr:magnesium transporter [Nematocida sp. LUAm3]KAI5175213.1 magnesium transporter [Nematocida sp. LUAm2]KAI5178115.1 magnesium transporter [Nematocida sp. LUAm1]
MNLIIWIALMSAYIKAESPYKRCTKDSECRVGVRTGTHSLFCVEGECVQLKASGNKCNSSTECASYPFFGPLSCSKKCADGFCCRAVPSGAACQSQRPMNISGCASGFSCQKKANGPICTPEFGKDWMIGPILSVTGNVLINLGLNLQKKSYLLPVYEVKGHPVNIFYFGLTLYFVGKVSGFSSYIFGKQSLMASLGAAGLVCNSILAPLINKELFTVYDFLSILFVLIGSSVILTHTGGGQRVHPIRELLRLYLSPITFLWFLFVISVICALYGICTVVEENSEWNLNGSPPIYPLNSKFTSNGKMLRYGMLFVYIGMSSLIASFTTLFAKSFGELVSLSIYGDNQFIYPAPYLFFCLIFLCMSGQIFWINRALKRYDALLVIPVFHILWTVTSVTTAGIYFKDFSMYSPQQFRGFLLGLSLIFLGSIFLIFRMVGKDDPSTHGVRLHVEMKQK